METDYNIYIANQQSFTTVHKYSTSQLFTIFTSSFNRASHPLINTAHPNCLQYLHRHSTELYTRSEIQHIETVYNIYIANQQSFTTVHKYSTSKLFTIFTSQINKASQLFINTAHRNCLQYLHRQSTKLHNRSYIQHIETVYNIYMFGLL